MSQPKTPQELIRMAWLTELRRNPDRQAFGPGRAKDHKACAMVVLAEMLGFPKPCYSENYNDAGRRAGLSKRQITQVIQMNDGARKQSAIHHVARGFWIWRKTEAVRRSKKVHTHTFPMIADAIESWFAMDKDASSRGKPLALRTKRRTRVQFIWW